MAGTYSKTFQVRAITSDSGVVAAIREVVKNGYSERGETPEVLDLAYALERTPRKSDAWILGLVLQVIKERGGSTWPENAVDRAKRIYEGLAEFADGIEKRNEVTKYRALRTIAENI
ncbi:MAG TPA: hypothetical protein VJJ76_01235 [archaeon]|nr:hypothetical protein [archaeon]